MPNPDGTRTRDEHHDNLIQRVSDYMRKGLTRGEAIMKAGEDYRDMLSREGKQKIARTLKALNVRQH